MTLVHKSQNNVSLTLRLPAEDYVDLVQYAKQHNLSINRAIATIVRAHLKQDDVKANTSDVSKVSAQKTSKVTPVPTPITPPKPVFTAEPIALNYVVIDDNWQWDTVNNKLLDIRDMSTLSNVYDEDEARERSAEWDAKYPA